MFYRFWKRKTFQNFAIQKHIFFWKNKDNAIENTDNWMICSSKNIYSLEKSYKNTFNCFCNEKLKPLELIIVKLEKTSYNTSPNTITQKTIYRKTSTVTMNDTLPRKLIPRTVKTSSPIATLPRKSVHFDYSFQDAHKFEPRTWIQIKIN